VKQLFQSLNEILNKTTRTKKLLTVLMVLVVFVTTYILILPAFTLTKDKAEQQGGIDVPGIEMTDDTDAATGKASVIEADSDGRAASGDADAYSDVADDNSVPNDNNSNNASVAGVGGEDTSKDDAAQADSAESTDDTTAPQTESSDKEEISHAKADSDARSESTSEAESDTSAAAGQPVQTDGSGSLTFEGEGFTIAVDDKKSVLPENTEVVASELVENPSEGTKAERKEAEEAYRKYYELAQQAVNDEAGSGGKDSGGRSISFVKFYDISLQSDGEELQPDKPVNVTISYDKDARKDLVVDKKDDVRIVHFAQDEETGEIVPEILEDKAVDTNLTVYNRLKDTSFEAESFSVYGVVYTVDFEFDINGKQYDFSIEGGNAITFREAIDLFEIMEIEDVDSFINNVASVEFSNPEYLWAGKVEEDIRLGELKDKNHLKVQYSSDLKQGNIDAINIRPIKGPDWVLVSLKPFKSEETLTVTMKNGDVFTIRVTDAQDDATIKPDGNVQTISNPAGTTIDLFDYWITDAYRTTAGRDAWPGHYRQSSGQVYPEFYQFDLYYPDGVYACAWDNWNFGAWHNGRYYTRDDLIRGNGNNQGINRNHNFKFTPGVGETVIDGTKGVKANDGNYGVNSWTENASPRPGIVQETLENGYPKLTTDTNLGTDGSSLDYLFNGSNGTGKQAYTGVNQLLYVDKDGYYKFDSNDFDAQFNTSSKTFTVSPQTNPTGNARGFWPFGNQVYWHGMHINTQFSMPVDGKVLSPTGSYNDMVFEFQGDDDTWVYVDGVLVGDGGGIHNQTRIIVNFREGTVLVSGEYDVRDDYRTDYHEVKYLDDLYREAGVYDQYRWVDSPTVEGHKTFAPNTYHTFDMFYLERGGGESNLYIRYNMIATYDFTAHKSFHNTTNERLFRDEFKFELIGLDGQYKNGVLTNANQAAIMPKGGSEGGSGNVGDAQKIHYAATGEKPGYTYFKVGVSEDGNVNFGAADFSSDEMHDCDEGNPSTYRYIIREAVPDDAVNEFGVRYGDATDEEKEEGGFILDGITYDDKIYYMTATVTRWQENGQWVYGLSKKYYTDNTYTTEASDAFASFVNGYVQPLTLKVLKTSDKGGQLLEGAEFSLVRAMHTDDQKWVRRHYEKNGETIYAPIRTGSTVSDGTLTFDNLTEGHYILEETAAPEGYETGETTKWLVTLTKQDAENEISLIPTFTPLNADGSVAGDASDPVNVDRNHTFEYQVVNGKPPINISLEKKWFDNGDENPPADASATFELHRVKDISPVRVELLDSQGVKICDVSAYVGDTVKIYDSGEHDFQHHTPEPNGFAVFFGDNYRDRSDTITPNDAGWTISTRNIYTLSGIRVILDSYTSTSSGQYTVKAADVNNGVVQLRLSENYLASNTYGFDKTPVLYVSNSAGGSGTEDEVVDTFTLPGDGDSGNSWKKSFNDLTQMDDQGHKYSYYFKEVSHTPATYNHQTIEGDMGSAASPLTGSGDVVITNSTPELPKIIAAKVWNDENGAPIDAESGLDELEVELTLYKGDAPAPESEIKNGSVTQTVIGNGTASWFLLDEDGDVTQYSVKETAVKIAGEDFIDVTTQNPFGGTVTGDSTTGYTVTNQLPKTEIEVTKEWKDGTSANADKVFDETTSISFTLYQKLGSNDGTAYMIEGRAVTGTVTYTPASGSAAASWSTETVPDLPKYVYSEGSWHEAAYYPVEDNIDGVTVTYKKGDGTPSSTPSAAATSSGTVTVINTDIVAPMKIVKVNSETNVGLTGASFQLTRKLDGETTFTKFVNSSFAEDPDNDNKKTGPFTVDSEEGIILEGLVPGEYQIEEKTAPAGYLITLEPFTFTVSADGTITAASDVDTDLVLHLDKQGGDPEGFRIGNVPGAELPHTGGIGTTIFYILGSLLVIGSAVVLISRRRIRK